MYKEEYIRSLVNMHTVPDKRKDFQVTKNYIAKIDEICLGIYVSSEGYSITALGIEEKYDPKIQRDFKRYWILENRVDEKNISYKNIHSYVVSVYNGYNLCCISTNSIHVLRILKFVKTPELVEINSKDIISLIKGCIRDKKLEIKEWIRPEIHDKLSNYNIDDENLFINSLYLALQYDYDSVLLTEDFPPLPLSEASTFEEIPLEELADYIRGNPDDKVAHTIYVTRWNEREKLEFEASEKNRE